ncbi:hypothetical protein MVEG_12139 [Podila verticillata NRRL 6337]|uniref:Uncharacterized protein n=1 Tax=Podila verticillata NRRL 6337 TaxID=1069443 RepID=A0A086TJ58_9FUNG|nr:hypothetical protein MVEG_12139 [Podila verticillata NRRL 6337]
MLKHSHSLIPSHCSMDYEAKKAIRVAEQEFADKELIKLRSMAREANETEDMIKIFNMSRELSKACQRQIDESNRVCEEHRKALFDLLVQDARNWDLMLNEVDDNAANRQAQPSLPEHSLAIDREWILHRRRECEEDMALFKAMAPLFKEVKPKRGQEHGSEPLSQESQESKPPKLFKSKFSATSAKIRQGVPPLEAVTYTELRELLDFDANPELERQLFKMGLIKGGKLIEAETEDEGKSAKVKEEGTNDEDLCVVV